MLEDQFSPVDDWQGAAFICARTLVLAGLSLLVLCDSALAGHSKPPASASSISPRSSQRIACAPAGDVSKRASLSAPALRNKNGDADDKPVDERDRNSAERDPLKLRFDPDGQQAQQTSSSECGKEQSERAKTECQGEKPEGSTLQCERAPAAKQDIVLPPSRRSEQE
jgi:hypothetical protein